MGLDPRKRLTKANSAKVGKAETVPLGKLGSDFLLQDEKEALTPAPGLHISDFVCFGLSAAALTKSEPEVLFGRPVDDVKCLHNHVSTLKDQNPFLMLTGVPTFNFIPANPQH